MKLKGQYSDIVLTVVFFLFCSGNTNGGLYNSSDPMVLLNNNNFYDTVIGTPNAWIIEFYSSWCGHCIKYAPTWREFSYQVLDWDHTIALGVLDCADKENGPICADYSINSFPTIRLFGANTQEGDMGFPLTKRDITSLQESMVDFIMKHEEANNGSHTWVNLLKYDGSIRNIFSNAPAEAVHAAIIVEDFNSKLGSYTILDLGNYPMVYVRSMDGESREFDTIDLPPLPAVVIAGRAGNLQVLREDVTTREEITAVIMKHLNLIRRKFEGGHGESNGTNNPSDEEVTTYTPLDNTDQMYMVDIENTLSYAFSHEVSLHKEISEEALEALTNFTSVLVEYLPARPPVHQFLVNLNDYLKDFTVITGDEYGTALQNIQSVNAILPIQQPWRGCRGSDHKYRGYPCGLWTTFHTLTVNAVLRKGDDPSYYPLQVLRAIHGYVKHFFGCGYCSQHFQAMYAKDAESDVQYPNDEIEWLWRGHNKVNQRLKGDLSEDPMHEKRLFPTEQRCPQCWEMDGSFNVLEVISYLKGIYGEGALSLKGTEDLSTYEAPKARTNEGKKNQVQNSVVFILSALFIRSIT